MRAAKADANQKRIVAALRAVGCQVRHLHRVGQGCPDLLVGRAGATYLLEVKAGRGSLTPDQVDWHQSWNGFPVAVVRDELEALGAVGAGGRPLWSGGGAK